MFNLGPGEMVLLFVVALLLFGPKRLPEFGRAMGESLASFRKAMNSLSEPLVSEVQSGLEAARPGPAPVAAPPAQEPPEEARAMAPDRQEAPPAEP
ncbi:MAG: twin-arginine translocase TatA/TatE family subunit [Candidatus Eremiobacterota bacterium]